MLFGNILLLGFFKFGNLWFGKRERENYEGICLAFISLSSGMGSIWLLLEYCPDDQRIPPFSPSCFFGFFFLIMFTVNICNAL